MEMTVVAMLGIITAIEGEGYAPADLPGIVRMQLSSDDPDVVLLGRENFNRFFARQPKKAETDRNEHLRKNFF